MVQSENHSLTGIQILADLAREELAALERLCAWKHYAPGEKIIDQDELTTEVLFIIKGEARIAGQAESGVEAELDILGEGSFFGELVALDGKPRSANVVATTDCLIASLASNDFKQILRNQPSIVFGVLGRLCQMVRIGTTGATMTENLRQAKKDAEIANLAKTDFLAHMSHELRTPLNAIIGFADVIKLQAFGPLGGEGRYDEYIGNIADAGQHLLNLISDLLDLSVIEAGKFEINEDPFQVALLARDCLNQVAPRAGTQGVVLTNSVADDFPDMIGDDRRVRQILINLLSNAVKFTPPGGKVTLHGRVEEDGWLAFAVSDTGIGMKMEDRAKAFTPFTKIDTDKPTADESTGLGLYLSRNLAEMHGGSLAIDSEIGKGTTVTVRFPGDRRVTG